MSIAWKIVKSLISISWKCTGIHLIIFECSLQLFIFLVSRRTSKPASPVAATSPKFEEQWSSFREQHQQEMNEMKQMYSALQSMCQEIKTFTLQSQGSSPPSKYCEDDSESLKATPQKVMLPARANSVASEKKRPPREKDVPTPRRAKSAPRTRKK